MASRPPATGLNLGLRLYLLLVAIMLPTLLGYYVYNLRTLEALHTQEISDVIRLVSLRLDSTVTAYGSMRDLRDRDRETLTRVFELIATDPDGVESLAAFVVARGGGLQHVAGFGRYAPTTHTAEDMRAVAERRAQQSDISRSDRPYIAVSVPVVEHDVVRAVIHFEMARGPIVASRTRMVTDSVDEWLRELRDKDRESLTRELKRIVGEGSVESVGVFLAAAGGHLELAAAHGPFAPTSPTGQDLNAAMKHAAQEIDLTRSERHYRAVSVPIVEDGALRGVVHIEILPETIGLAGRLPALRFGLIVGAAGMIIIVGLGIGLFFHFAVRRPIDELTHAMGQAAEGNLTALVDARAGELGWLATSYNRMIRQLKSGVDENRRLLEQIRGFNEDLQRKISAATQELEAKNTQLEAVNEKLFALQRQMTTQEKLATLGEVAAIIAHELGTPLNAISGHLQMLQAEGLPDPKAQERLRVIDGQVDRLTGIVHGVLSAMRVPPPRLARVDVGQVVRDVAELVGPMAQKRGIALKIDANGSVPPIQADGDQMQQVLMNLFTNAMDAMGKGGTLTVDTAFVTRDEMKRQVGETAILLESDGYVRVDVSDTGRGMEESLAKRVFEPFYSTKRPDGGIGMGLGLGLAICRQIVRNHHGEITVRTEQGAGTSFLIYMPAW